MSEPKRAALYLRISTDESQQPWSLGAQEERLRAYGKAQGWTVARTYTDRASGATLERPELRRALDDARLGRFDVLVVVRVDRLSRNLAQLASLAELLEEADVALVSATEPFDTANPTGRMLFQLLGSFAEFERAMIVDRITQGLERRARSGRWTSGRIPYGYRRTGGGAIEPDPLQAPVVREVFRLYVDERLGTPTIARRLNARGERTRSGGRWRGPAVAAILSNRADLGLVAWRGEHHPGDHEPLIDEEVFEVAARILSERGEQPRFRRGNAAPPTCSRGSCAAHAVAPPTSACRRTATAGATSTTPARGAPARGATTATTTTYPGGRSRRASSVSSRSCLPRPTSYGTRGRRRNRSAATRRRSWPTSSSACALRSEQSRGAAGATSRPSRTERSTPGFARRGSRSWWRNSTSSRRVRQTSARRSTRTRRGSRAAPSSAAAPS